MFRGYPFWSAIFVSWDGLPMFVDCLLRRKSCLGTVHVQRRIPDELAREGAIILTDGEAWMVCRVGQIVHHDDTMSEREAKLYEATSA